MKSWFSFVIGNVMKKPTIATGALAGLLLTAPLVAVLYLANRLAGLAFPPFDAFDWLRDKVPGGFLNAGIEALARTLTALGLSLRTTSKPAEIIMVLGMFLAMGVIAGMILFAVLRRARDSWRIWVGLILGSAVGFPLTLINLNLHKSSGLSNLGNPVWTLAVFLVWGYGFVWIYRSLAGAVRRQEPARVGIMTVENDEPPQISRLTRRGQRGYYCRRGRIGECAGDQNAPREENTGTSFELSPEKQSGGQRSFAGW